MPERGYYSWSQKDAAHFDYEIQSIRGRGVFPSEKVLRDIGYRSYHEKVFLAAADHIEELKQKITHLEEELRRERKFSSELSWRADTRQQGSA